MTNAQDLIGVHWGSVIILPIPSCPHLYNKTHPRFSLNTETVLAARVKVHKARRAIHTNAGNSCFCYSSHQFNETWSDQIKKKEVLENCALVGLGCWYCMWGSLRFVHTSHCVATQNTFILNWLCIHDQCLHDQTILHSFQPGAKSLAIRHVAYSTSCTSSELRIGWPPKIIDCGD